MTEQQIKLKIIENAEVMAKAIYKGKDVEIKTCSSGLKFLSADKEVLR